MWTNFEEDHLDYHEDNDKIFFAKANMFNLLGTGTCLIGKSVKDYAEKIIINFLRQTEGW